VGNSTYKIISAAIQIEPSHLGLIARARCLS